MLFGRTSRPLLNALGCFLAAPESVLFLRSDQDTGCTRRAFTDCLDHLSDRAIERSPAGRSVKFASFRRTQAHRGFLRLMGKLLVMFFAGLEIDIAQFRRERNKSIIFGLVTTWTPLLLGTAVGLFSRTSPFRRSY